MYWSTLFPTPSTATAIGPQSSQDLGFARSEKLRRAEKEIIRDIIFGYNTRYIHKKDSV
jgi:hypothetical protein